MEKHICITGCTRGLGRALVDWFVKEGWRVSGFGRNEKSIQELRSTYEEGGHYFAVVDVTAEENVVAFCRDVANTVGVPDVVFNNAAAINANAPLWEIPSDEFARVIEVNVNGVVTVIRHFTPLMIEKGTGIMLNVSSGWGRSTSPEVAPYCASKWAVEGLSQAMSQELPRGVAVAAVNPGIINTEMLQSCFGESAAAYGGAEDWANRAGPFILGLDTSCNGRQLTVPS